MSWRRWAGRAVGVLMVALLGFVFGWVPWSLAGVATQRRGGERPDRHNAGLSPASYQLAFEDVRFEGEGGVALFGWWVPARENRGSAVLLHGLNRSRVEMIRRVPFLNEHGWNVLLFDQRMHGASGGDAGSFGAREQDDAKAAVREARRRSGGAPVVLWGVSLGAATATLAAASDPSIDGLVSDSSFRSLRDTVGHHLGLFRRFRWYLNLVPRWPTADIAVYWIVRRGRFDPDALDVEAAAVRVADRPSLFVCTAGDRRMPMQIAFDLSAAAGERSRVLVIPGESHGGAWREGTEAYAAAVRELLEEVAPVGVAGENRGVRPEPEGPQAGGAEE